VTERRELRVGHPEIHRNGVVDIRVDEQNSRTLRCETRGQMEGRLGLACAALKSGDRDAIRPSFTLDMR
jgi:hypothetical protein